MLAGLFREYLKPHLSDRAFIYGSHFRVHGRFPDLKRQRTFSDRMAYRRLCPRKVFTPLSAKTLVRNYVAERVGPKYLIPLLGITSSMDAFRFEDLPSSFAMKASHGSRWNKLVHNIEQQNINSLKRLGRSWLSQSYHKISRERHYINIPREIIFEELLLEDREVPKDYKVHCFRKNGLLTQIVQVHSGRFYDHRVNFFSSSWKPIGLSNGMPQLSETDLPRPDCLKNLLAIADVLSRDFNYVRVDLYMIKDRIYFGELTFTPGAGLLKFDPVEMDEVWADLFERDQPGADRG